MAWKCKLCNHISKDKSTLLDHYRFTHSSYATVTPLPCLFDNCLCTFKSTNALKIHLSRTHADVAEVQATHFTCSLCAFSQRCSEDVYFSHLRSHLKKKETVTCPFPNCSYKTNVYSSFNTHKSRSHTVRCVLDGGSVSSSSDVATAPAHLEAHSLHELDNAPSNLEDCSYNVDVVRSELHKKLATLFLKMQTVLHVSDRACQEIIGDLREVLLLSQSVIKDTVKDVLKKHCVAFSEAFVDDLAGAILNSNAFLCATNEKEDLSSAKRRKTYIERNFPVVKPVSYVLEPGHSAVYIPILDMIQEICKHTDVISRIKETLVSQEGFYNTYKDGSYSLENPLLCAPEFTLPLILYIDDLEIANPLGTSRKIHKLCSVYWVFADLPAKYRSALHVIQLAALCKVPDVKQCGFQKALGPLLRDLHVLETDGVFIEQLGRTVRGTVSCVLSDNLAAHSLAGFTQCFRTGYICRFCKATHNQIQSLDAVHGEFSLRTKTIHDCDVESVIQGNPINFGVKGDCILRESLDYFHPITGFPPDALHDLLEGIVPVELALCVGKMIRLKYFTLDYLNKKIQSFPYQCSDLTDKPRPISKTFTVKKSIGGNGHENSTLLRLLPLMIGNAVPEEDDAWSILMDLKEILALVLSPAFDDEMLQYLQSKILDHRQTLQETFPDFLLRPKHHYLEHYPHLIQCFGPLVHLWTMRFEGKHRFFKRVVHDIQNFKNVLKTLATKHQHMMALHLSSSAFFKPHQQTSTVTSRPVSQLPEEAQQYVRRVTAAENIYVTPHVTVEGTQYVVGMFVSIGHEGGLPSFSKVEQILLVNGNIVFLCNDHKAFYIEHLRSFELAPAASVSVHSINELNDSLPLCAYSVDGKLLLTTKRFILPPK